MKIVVIRNTGPIGSKTVPMPRQSGHNVFAAITQYRRQHAHREGLKEAMIEIGYATQ